MGLDSSPASPKPHRVALDPTDFIRAHLPIAPAPGIPEIRLHKASPQTGLRRLAEEDDGFGSPYWAYHWAGGLALARYVLDHPETVAGRRVLDLGTGAGLVAIAAGLAGAKAVIGADTDGYAIAALALNAPLNGVTVVAVHDDLTAKDPPPVDIVLVGDLFYDQATADRVFAFLDKCLAAGIEVRIGDPWRAHLPEARLELLVRYQVAESGARTVPSGVFRLRP